MIRMIVAMNKDKIIGLNNKLPWSYPDDLKFFKSKTKYSNIIMGKNTFISINKKPLPSRRNIVITSTEDYAQTDCYSSLEIALNNCIGDIWLIGGASIYEAGMQYADEIIITIIPDKVKKTRKDKIIYFPKIDYNNWKIDSEDIHPYNKNLKVQILKRRTEDKWSKQNGNKLLNWLMKRKLMLQNFLTRTIKLQERALEKSFKN